MDKKTIRIRRVGSVTFGMVLVATGILFLIHLFFPALNYETVFRLWPFMLISLGIEVLLGSRQKEVQILKTDGTILEENRIKYDVPAIVLTAGLTFFIMLMATVDWLLVHAGGHIEF